MILLWNNFYKLSICIAIFNRPSIYSFWFNDILSPAIYFEIQLKSSY